jgi:phosphate transport system permease protein
MMGLTTLSAVFVIVILFLILAYILIGGARFLSPSFLINTPVPEGEPNSGIANGIIGSFIMVSVASLIAIPIGILAGLYLAESEKPKLAGAIRFFIDTLIGIPSILIGVFAWTAFVSPDGLVFGPLKLRIFTLGHFSGFAGAMALSIMMAPIVARTSEEMIRLVPMELREAALALGAPRWRVSLGVVLRTSASGIATGCMLAIARVAGETAPLLFTALGLDRISTNLRGQMSSLTNMIYYYAGSPYEDWHAMAWTATLVLISIIFFLNIFVKYVVRNRYQ